MVYIPGGEFEMGSTEGEEEQPVHIVELDGFWIDRTEVTNAQYQSCVDAEGCEPPSERRSSTRAEYYGNSVYAVYPVIRVSWYQARTYCESVGARLPTEAEWEYAARGSDSLVYPWGDSPPSDALANCCHNVGDTTRVGAFPDGASWCGALDMAGNVWEWVADWYGDYPYERQVSPTGLSSGDLRVLRGGSWGSLQYVARCAFRYGYPPDTRYDDVGFRCAGDSE